MAKERRTHRQHHGRSQESATRLSTRTASVASRRAAARNPALAEKLRHMALPLAPLVQLTTGRVHADFPRTLLHFWLLTDSQLESLAAFYHQRIDSGDPGDGGDDGCGRCGVRGSPEVWKRQYPCPVPWSSAADLETKRRRLGRFIGLRGCESPTKMTFAEGERIGGGGWRRMMTEEEIAEQARRERIEEEEMRRKHRWC